MPVLKATNEQIIQAYKATGSVWKAAKQLGLGGQSVWERLKILGHPLFSQKWTGEEIAELRLLAPQCTIGEIARRLGRPYSGVAGKISELQIGVRAGNHGPRKVQRGSGFTKKSTATLMSALRLWEGSVRQFCVQRGLEIERLVTAFQQYCPDDWQDYVRAHTDLKQKSCPECKRDFYPFNIKQLTCSRRCASRRRSNLDYFGGKRSFAVGMEEGVCQLCEKEFKTRLAAHHVIGKANDPDNNFLIALCNGCHQLVGTLGGRADVRKPEFWENLIALAVMRKDGAEVPVGYHVGVSIDAITQEHVDHELDCVA